MSERASAHGTVHLPLDLPGARSGEPVLLPLMLGDAVDAPAVRLTPHDLPFDPVASRRFARHDRIRIHARVLNPGPAALRVLSAGMPAEVLTAPLAMTRIGERLDLLGTVDLATLSPGPYVLELIVATAEGRTERRAVRIDVEQLVADSLDAHPFEAGRPGRINYPQLFEPRQAMTHVDVTIPDGLLAALKKAPHEVAAELRLAAAIHWYQQSLLSMERAAETAGLTRAEFLAELARRRVDVFVVDDQDLARELGDA